MPERWSAARRWGALLAFAAILVGGFEPHYLYALAGRRIASEATLRELPYRKLPGYRELMTAAADLVPAGDRVAFWMLDPRWEAGYEYGWYRSGYILAGRQIVPLIDSQNRFYPAHLEQSDWIVCWRCDVPFTGFRTVWRGPSGSVATRS